MLTMAQLLIKNSSFTSSITSSLSSLLSSSSFCDVTLMCDRKGQFSAHKVVLSASSEFFHLILSQHTHPHPLLYMRGVDKDMLQSILEYVYTGATSVAEDMVEKFLALGEDLKIVGLVAGQTDIDIEGKKDKQKFEYQENVKPNDDSQHKDSNQDVKYRQDVIKNHETKHNVEDKHDIEHRRDKQINEMNHNFERKENLNTNKIEAVKQCIPSTLTKSSNNNKKAVITATCVISSCEDNNSENIESWNRSQEIKDKGYESQSSKPVTSQKRRKCEPKSVLCPVCQLVDYKTDDLRVHMEGLRTVQCKSCRLFFTNCYRLMKHKRGRCKEKK